MSLFNYNKVPTKFNELELKPVEGVLKLEGEAYLDYLEELSYEIDKVITQLRKDFSKHLKPGKDRVVALANELQNLCKNYIFRIVNRNLDNIGKHFDDINNLAHNMTLSPTEPGVMSYSTKMLEDGSNIRSDSYDLKKKPNPEIMTKLKQQLEFH